MKFDMGRAWNEATSMIAANRELVAIIAGIFVFLPSLVLAIVAPEMISGPTEVNPEDPLATMTAFYSENGLWIFLLAIVQAVGSLALFSLFTDGRPTVGDAIKTGAVTLVPYILAQILLVLVIAVVIGVPIGLAVAAGGPAAGALVGILGFVAFIYMMVKFSLLAPVMVIAGVLNPAKALKTSWDVTKGNSIRLLLFYVLLMLAVIVVAVVFGLVSGLLVAMLGTGAVSLMVAGAINGILGAVWAVLIVSVLSASYRQLAGPSATEVSETFE